MILSLRFATVVRTEGQPYERADLDEAQDGVDEAGAGDDGPGGNDEKSAQSGEECVGDPVTS